MCMVADTSEWQKQGTGQLREEHGIQNAGSIEQKDYKCKAAGEEASDRAAGVIVVDNGDLLRTLFELRGEACRQMGGIGGGTEDSGTKALQSNGAGKNLEVLSYSSP